MKIQMEENAITADELKSKLEADFPDYQFTTRNKKMFVVKKSNVAGTNVVVYKKRILVGAAFPTMGGQMLFVFSFLLLGILIPFIVYLAAFQPKQKELEREIGAAVQKELEP